MMMCQPKAPQAWTTLVSGTAEQESSPRASRLLGRELQRSHGAAAEPYNAAGITVELALTRSLRSSPDPVACPGRCGRGRASCPGCDSGLPCPAGGRPCPPRAAAAPQRDRPDCAGVGTRGGGQHAASLDNDLAVSVPAKACREAEAADTSPTERGACVGYHHRCVSELPHIQRLHLEQLVRNL